MMNARRMMAASAMVGVLAVIGSARAQSTRVLPTVNKIDLATGAVTTFSPYASNPLPPSGIAVAIVGDNIVEPTETFGYVTIDQGSANPKVVVRGWDFQKKGEVSTHDIDGSAPFGGFVATGVLRDGTNLDRTVVVGNGYQSSPPGTRSSEMRVASWSLGATNSGSTTSGGMSQGRFFTPFGQGFSGAVSVACDVLSTDGFGILAAAEQETGGGTSQKNYVGHVTLIKQRTGETRTFAAVGNTYGGGIQVATGDVNGDGVSEIVTVSRNKTPRIADCLAINVFSRDGTLLSTKAWETTLATSVGPNGECTGRIATGDVDGDGLDEIIVTKATAAGPVCSYFDITGGGTVPLSFGSENSVDLSALPSLPSSDDPSLPYAALTASYFKKKLTSSGSGEFAIASAADSGTLFLALEIVPEPTTLSAVGAAGLLLARRRKV